MDKVNAHLTMYVGQSEQASVIGTKGSNINRITCATKAFIQFDKKTNIVTIEGNVNAIETSRSQIRLSSSLVIWFPIKTKDSSTLLEIYQSEIRLIEQKHKVKISFHHCLVRVRSEIKNENGVKQSVRSLIILFYRKEIPNFEVQTNVEIPHEANDFIKSSEKITEVERATGTSIIIANKENPNTGTNSIFIVKGCIDRVCRAKEKLLQYMPVDLVYELNPNADDINTDVLASVGYRHATYVRQMEYECGRIIVIQFVEKFMESGYRTLHDLLKGMTYVEHIYRTSFLEQAKTANISPEKINSILVGSTSISRALSSTETVRCNPTHNNNNNNRDSTPMLDTSSMESISRTSRNVSERVLNIQMKSIYSLLAP